MPANWFDGVQLTVEVAWDSDPLSASPVWTDESTRVRRNVPIQISPEGRDSEWDDMQPGSASFAFINDDRRFDTEYAASPLAGKLLPMKRVRISAAYGETSEVLFDGFIQGYPQFPTGPTTGDVRITAIDGNWVLANSKLGESVYVQAVLDEEDNGAASYPECYWPLQGSGEPAIGDLVLEDGSYTDIGYPKGSGGILNGDFLDADDQVESVGEAELPVIVGFSCLVRRDIAPLFPYIRIYNDNLSWLRCDGVFSATIEYSNEAMNRYIVWDDDTSDFTYGGNLPDPADSTLRADERYYSLTVWYDTNGVYLAINGVVDQQILNSELSTISYVGTRNAGFVGIEADYYDVVPTKVVLGPGVSHLQLFTEPPNLAKIRQRWLDGLHGFGYPVPDSSGARIGRILDEIDYPGALRNLTDGSSWCGPYVAQGRTAREAIQDVARAEQGYAFMAPDGRLTFLDRDWIINNERSTTPQLTVTDGGADIEIVGNALESVRNDVEVEFGDVDSAQSGTVRSLDVASRDAYTPVSTAVDLPTVEFRSLAKSFADFRIDVYGQPRTLIHNLTVKPRKDPDAYFPAILKLRNGDRVRAGRTPQGVSPPMYVDGHVQRVQHRILKDNWETQVYLSPAAPSFSEGPYLTKDDATYGVTGDAAGNKIPY